MATRHETPPAAHGSRAHSSKPPGTDARPAPLLPDLSVTTTPEGLVLGVLARPGASSDALVGVAEGALVIRISAPPVEGAANERLVRFMAKEILKLPKSKVRLDAGERSRHKRLVIEGLTETELREILEKSLQSGG